MLSVPLVVISSLIDTVRREAARQARLDIATDYSRIAMVNDTATRYTPTIMIEYVETTDTSTVKCPEPRH